MEKKCDVCDGSGQRPHFKGVSRFLLSWEECPVCAGLGYLVVPDPPAESDPNGPRAEPGSHSN